MLNILDDRKHQVLDTKKDEFSIQCGRRSTAGSVSQRACVFCGSRVVLYPVADALHLIHGPVGCAAYTWDIRGSLSSGPELHRMSYTTDLQEQHVIYGGEKRLLGSLKELIRDCKPKAAFVYSTCIVGLIGDDVEAICREAEAEFDIPVIPVHSEGFKGTKKDGYAAACSALERLVGTDNTTPVSKLSINILGDFNIAGEIWGLRKYYEDMGIEVVSTITGDGRVDDIRKSHRATLNVVQCSGSMIHLAKTMKEKYGVPFIRVSYFGIEDMAKSLYDVAKELKDEEVLKKAREIVSAEMRMIMPELAAIKKDLQGKKAAIYVGGAFKAISLVQAMRHIGVTTAIAGSQTGNEEDYKILKNICDPGTVIVDDTNPVELSHFVQEMGVHVFIGGVKERPLAYKLGIGFCDHNHERKINLAGFEGMLNFAREIHQSIMSPVWKFARPKGSIS